MKKSEHQEQCEFVSGAKKYLRDTGNAGLRYSLWAIPNGGRRDPRTAASLSREGVKKGVPDLFFAYATGKYHGLFIEMKVVSGGRVSPEQKRMMKHLEGQGYKCEVAKGCKEAMRIFKEYIGGAE